MKLTVLPALAATAMAQMTLPPSLNNFVNVAADLDACATAADVLLACANQAGGLDAMLTVNPDDLLNCACCSSQTPLATAYSSCSDYLSEESLLAATDYEVYGMVYSVCQMEECGGGDMPAATTTETEEDIMASSTSSGVMSTDGAAMETETQTETETATETETETEMGEPTGSETEATNPQETEESGPTDAGVQLRMGSAGVLMVALAFAALW